MKQVSCSKNKIIIKEPPEMPQIKFHMSITFAKEIIKYKKDAEFIKLGEKICNLVASRLNNDEGKT